MMKKLITTSVLALTTLFSAVSFATANDEATSAPETAAPLTQPNPYGGYGQFGGNGFQPLNTVGAIQSAQGYIDDFPVTLQGTLGKQVGYEYYEFTDGTGTMVVEIDHEHFWGQQFAPGSQIMIYGEVDYKGHGIIVDADFVRPL